MDRGARWTAGGRGPPQRRPRSGVLPEPPVPGGWRSASVGICVASGCAMVLLASGDAMASQQLPARDGLVDRSRSADLNRSTRIMVYHDSNWASIWGMFTTCYAYSTASAAHPLYDLRRRCRPHQPAGKPLGRRLLTPAQVPRCLVGSVLSELEQGHDVLHLDVDVFLYQHPVQTLRDRYPTADIVSSPDCVAEGTFCRWYLGGTAGQVFRGRHGGTDPLAKLGVMLNTGWIYFRSTPQVVELLRASSVLMDIDDRVKEQVVINEALLHFNCSWALDGGGAAPGQAKWKELLRRQDLIGNCDGGLRVVVLPYVRCPRDLLSFRPSASLGVHPGGSTFFKMLPLRVFHVLCALGTLWSGAGVDVETPS